MRRVSLLARKLLMADRVRVLVTGLAIVLVSLLFMTVLSISASLMQAEVLIKQLATGSDFYGLIKELNPEEAQSAASHSLVKTSYILSEKGDVYAQQDRIDGGGDTLESKSPLLMACEDETFLSHLFLKIEAGRYPETENEILLSRKWLEEQGLPTQAGAELSLRINNEPQRFQLSGTFVSLADETANESAFTRGVGESRTVYFVFYNSVNIEGKMARVAQSIGLSPRDSRVIVNDAFIFARSRSVSAGSLFMFALALAFVFATGFFVIYSIYFIALRRDLRAYGLLKTLGMTGRQLKQLVFVQINAIWCLFVPAGIGLGYFIGWRLLTPLYMSLSGRELALYFTFNPVLLVFTLLFTYATAALSAQAPVRQIAKMSCFEALLEGESSNLSKRDKRSLKRALPATQLKRSDAMNSCFLLTLISNKVLKRGKTGNMALANVFREPKRALATVFSIGLSVVLFLFVVNVTRLIFRPDRIQAADYLVLMKTTEIDKRETLYTDEPFLDTQMLEELSSLQGLTGMGSVIPVYGTYLKAALADEEGEREVLVLGISEAMVPYLTQEAVVEGRFDRSSFFKGGYVLAAGNVQTASKSSVTPVTEPNAALVTEPTAAPGPLALRTGQVLSLDAFQGDFTVMGISEGHHRFLSGLIQLPYYMTEGVVFFMAESDLKARLEGGGLMAISVFTSSEKPSAALSDIMAQFRDKGFSVELRQDQLKEMNTRLNALRIVGYSLCGIVLLAGVINFVNTTVCGVYSRRRELALLEIVGMTRGHIKKMLMVESLCYVFFSSLFGLLAGYPFIRLIFAVGDIRQGVNLWPLGVSCAFLSLVAVLCTLSAARLLEKGTPVEHLCRSV